MEQLEIGLKKHFRPIYLGLILSAAVMYLILSMDPLVWADEAYTMAIVRHSYREIWQITTADVHPPLYYFLLKTICASLLRFPCWRTKEGYSGAPLEDCCCAPFFRDEGN